MSSCREFRQHLEQALSGPAGRGLSELSWHRHLTACRACRDLLEAEEVLELLLDSLPDPALPPALAKRVLLRLRTDRNDEALERLLALDDHVDAPEDLSRRVLAGLSGSRGTTGDGPAGATGDPERALDRVLDRLPEPVPPSGLAERVLAGLAATTASSGVTAADERALDRVLDRLPEPASPSGLAERVLDRLEPARSGPVPFVRRLERWAAAALVVAGLGTALWILDVPRAVGLGGIDPAEIARKPANEVRTDLLEKLDLLAHYDLLRPEFRSDAAVAAAGDDDLLLQLGVEVEDVDEGIAGWTGQGQPR